MGTILGQEGVSNPAAKLKILVRLGQRSQLDHLEVSHSEVLSYLGRK